MVPAGECTRGGVAKGAKRLKLLQEVKRLKPLRKVKRLEPLVGMLVVCRHGCWDAESMLGTERRDWVLFSMVLIIKRWMKVEQTVVVLERLESTSNLVPAAASKQAAAASVRTVSAAALHDPWSDIGREVAALQGSAAAAVL